MRRWVVTNILDSERAYLSTLDILLQVCALILLIHIHLLFYWCLESIIFCVKD